MTYDLAVWEGKQPANDVEGGRIFSQLYDEYIDADETPSTPRIRAYVDALLERWIDMTEDEEDVSPWSTGPMINNASGPIIYFGMRYSMCEEVSAEAARMAADQGLVCFDVQWDRLRPAPEEDLTGPSTGQ